MAAGGHPFGDKEYGEYPESELEVEDPEVDLGKDEEQGWQLPVSSRGRRDEDLLLPRPEPQLEAPPPDLPEELPELNLQLELFPEQHLPPELPGGEEQGSGDLPQLHDRELLALQDGKEDEEGRGRKRRRSKERRRRGKEEGKRRKERKGSRSRKGKREILAILDRTRINPTKVQKPVAKVQIPFKGKPKVQAKVMNFCVMCEPLFCRVKHVFTWTWNTHAA